MPNDTIERSIKKAAGNEEGVEYELVTYEGYGPSGVAVIVEALTDNRNRAAANVRNAFTKGGGNMGTNGCVSFMFDQKGLIVIDKEEKKLKFADDVHGELLCPLCGKPLRKMAWGYGCTGYAFGEVREALEKEGVPMASAEVTMIPQTYTELKSDEDIKKMNKLLDMLDDDDDVQNVYHNWDE